MPIPGTLAITGPIAPTATSDTYPSHLSKYGKGGFRTVADSGERDAIPALRREAGMVVYVVSSGAYERLKDDLATWEPLSESLLGGFRHTHIQSTPSIAWEVIHNLNGYPSVTTTDLSGNTIYGEVHYVSTSVISISFSAPTSGFAHLN